MSEDLLVVGSGLEAQLALLRLQGVEFGGKLLHLPTSESIGDYQFLSAKHFGEIGSPAPSQATLADVWGKRILSLKLPPLRALESGTLPSPDSIAKLASGLKVSRSQQEGDRVLVSLSDGSELLCRGVLFCDGVRSQGQAFWTKPWPSKADSKSVRCWTFSTPNLLDIKNWEFRWAAAKSVEIVPVSGGRVLVRMRFKSPFGGKLTVTELKELFSEFGSDMTALFENVTESEIDVREERQAEGAVYSPAKGCVALGRAAWPFTPLLLFDWLSEITTWQLDIIIEQVRTGTLNPESFEAQVRLQMREYNERERFVRHHLHSDNALLRPFRNLILKLIPNPILVSQLKKKIFIT